MTGEWRDYLMEIKYNFDPKMIPELSGKFSEMDLELSKTYQDNEDRFKPDIEWIENFILKAYTCS
jgi:hypothetical protein